METEWIEVDDEQIKDMFETVDNSFIHVINKGESVVVYVASHVYLYGKDIPDIFEHIGIEKGIVGYEADYEDLPDETKSTVIS